MADGKGPPDTRAWLWRLWLLIILVWMGLATHAIYEFAGYLQFTDELSRILGGTRAIANPYNWLSGILLLLGGLLLPALLARRAWRRLGASRP